MTQRAETTDGETIFYLSNGKKWAVVNFRRADLRDELVKLWESGCSYKVFNARYKKMGGGV